MKKIIMKEIMKTSNEAASGFEKAAEAIKKLNFAIRKIPWYARWWINISSWIDEKLGIDTMPSRNNREKEKR